MKKIIAVIFIVVAFALSPALGLISLFIFIAINKINKEREVSQTQLQSNLASEKIEINPLKCAKCGSVLNPSNKVCDSCGEPFLTNEVAAISNDGTVTSEAKAFVKHSDFDPMYALSDDLLLLNFIKKEMVKAGITEDNKLLIPSSILKRKNIFNIIFSVLLFIYIVLIFFHFPIFTYIIGFLILFIFYKKTRKFTLEKYLIKEVKSRPGEKISNIIMSTKESLTLNKSHKVLILGNVIAIFLGVLLFIKPVILYEKDINSDGYVVRFYAFGLTNFTTATIPETHNNKPVVSLRGNTFSNMPFLKEVKLPDSIHEIRGQAFKNNKKLKKVNIPNNLNYLGGGAFYNCKSLETIELPDTLTYLGGESFKNAKSLKHVKLSNNLPEIRGNTFENCVSLTEIIIPDSVTRIGGHAFYNNSSLYLVKINPTSNLNEIGSSAFRLCSRLSNITLPKTVYVNSRAFKESPTNVEFYE